MDELEVADWRRQVQLLYSEVRSMPSPEAAHDRWRRGRDRLFREHPQSPLPADSPLRDTGVPYWPYDPRLRWTLPVEPAAEPAAHALDTGSDGTTGLAQLGWLSLPEPVNARVALWSLRQYAGGLFLPLKDGTAGGTTYGGGRYLLDTAKGADLGGDGSHLVVDLNFLYHPSCRYDPRWVCPLAPPENAVAAAVPAGERL